MKFGNMFFSCQFPPKHKNFKKIVKAISEKISINLNFSFVSVDEFLSIPKFVSIIFTQKIIPKPNTEFELFTTFY